MTFAQQLSRHINDFYFGPNQTGVNFKDTMEGIDLAQASKKIGDHNSILALTFHIDYYIQGITAVLEGGELTIRDKFSYDHPVLTSEVAWLDFVDKVFANGKKFSELIGKLDDDALNASFVKPEYGNFYRNLAGITEHCYYHLGQIALIKKLTSPA